MCCAVEWACVILLRTKFDWKWIKNVSFSFNQVPPQDNKSGEKISFNKIII